MAIRTGERPVVGIVLRHGLVDVHGQYSANMVIDSSGITKKLLFLVINTVVSE